MFSSKREIASLKQEIESLKSKIRLVDRIQKSREQDACEHKDLGFDVYTVQPMLRDGAKETRLSIKCMLCDKVMRDVGGHELIMALENLKD